MEFFFDIASEDEFAGITGIQPGSPQMEKMKEHLRGNPEDNAECLAWLYTLRGLKEKAEAVLALLPEDRRNALKMRLELVSEDVRLLRDQKAQREV